MSTKTTPKKPATSFGTLNEAMSDAQAERFLAEHHDEIDAKLQEARASIARGEAKPLEPFHVLLRDARRRFKVAG